MLYILSSSHSLIHLPIHLLLFLPLMHLYLYPFTFSSEKKIVHSTHTYKHTHAIHLRSFNSAYSNIHILCLKFVQCFQLIFFSFLVFSSSYFKISFLFSILKCHFMMELCLWTWSWYFCNRFQSICIRFIWSLKMPYFATRKKFDTKFQRTKHTYTHTSTQN